MNSRILNFREFLMVSESSVESAGNNDEILEKMIDALIRDGAKAAALMQQEFNVLATLFNTEIKEPKPKFSEYNTGGTFDHSVRNAVYPKVYSIDAKSNPVNLGKDEIEKRTFIMLNNYLYYSCPESKKASIINTYGGEGKQYPNLNKYSFDNLKRLLRDMGLDGTQIFGQYWKNYSDYKYAGIS